ncbi:Cortactin-binding protein like [Actinidia chinensis var. chinensis]|uniref:Cortactin-binding protein like n=1 Tax=Actinidia chinensis var. chinensis TaxID=1590841 RepID=A0A2R6QGW6_ACTCC|nr:Cortactin-binding protein like [Actinidia chinensis var. chinensis]
MLIEVIFAGRVGALSLLLGGHRGLPPTLRAHLGRDARLCGCHVLEFALNEIGHRQPGQGLVFLTSLSRFRVLRNSELGMTAFGHSRVEPEDPALPISISSSDNEHLNDLARAPPQSMREVEAIGSRSGETNIMRFRNLKKATPATDPLVMDNLAWNKAALAPNFLESPTPYSPMILPGFDEEEYMNRPDEDEDISEPIHAREMAPTNEDANLAEEARKTIAEVYGERSVEEIGRDDGEDASRDPPPEL